MRVLQLLVVALYVGVSVADISQLGQGATTIALLPGRRRYFVFTASSSAGYTLSAAAPGISDPSPAIDCSFTVPLDTSSRGSLINPFFDAAPAATFFITFVAGPKPAGAASTAWFAGRGGVYYNLDARVYCELRDLRSSGSASVSYVLNFRRVAGTTPSPTRTRSSATRTASASRRPSASRGVTPTSTVSPSLSVSVTAQPTVAGQLPPWPLAAPRGASVTPRPASASGVAGTFDFAGGHPDALASYETATGDRRITVAVAYYALSCDPATGCGGAFTRLQLALDNSAASPSPHTSWSKTETQLTVQVCGSIDSFSAAALNGVGSDDDGSGSNDGDAGGSAGSNDVNGSGSDDSSSGDDDDGSSDSGASPAAALSTACSVMQPGATSASVVLRVDPSAATSRRARALAQGKGRGLLRQRDRSLYLSDGQPFTVYVRVAAAVSWPASTWGPPPVATLPFRVSASAASLADFRDFTLYTAAAGTTSVGAMGASADLLPDSNSGSGGGSVGGDDDEGSNDAWERPAARWAIFGSAGGLIASIAVLGIVRTSRAHAARIAPSGVAAPGADGQTLRRGNAYADLAADGRRTIDRNESGSNSGSSSSSSSDSDNDNTNDRAARRVRRESRAARRAAAAAVSAATAAATAAAANAGVGAAFTGPLRVTVISGAPAGSTGGAAAPNGSLFVGVAPGPAAPVQPPQPPAASIPIPRSPRPRWAQAGAASAPAPAGSPSLSTSRQRLLGSGGGGDSDRDPTAGHAELIVAEGAAFAAASAPAAGDAGAGSLGRNLDCPICMSEGVPAVHMLHLHGSSHCAVCKRCVEADVRTRLQQGPARLPAACPLCNQRLSAADVAPALPPQLAALLARIEFACPACAAQCFVPAAAAVPPAEAAAGGRTATCSAATCGAIFCLGCGQRSHTGRSCASAAAAAGATLALTGQEPWCTTAPGNTMAAGAGVRTGRGGGTAATRAGGGGVPAWAVATAPPAWV